MFNIPIAVYFYSKILGLDSVLGLFRALYNWLREDTHKKVAFLVVGPLRVYPLYTNGLVVNATFFLVFFSVIIDWNGFWQFFSSSPIYGLKKPDL